MKKTLQSLFLLFTISGFSQIIPDYVTVDVNSHTVDQLVTNVLVNSPSANISNFSSSKACGFGYFNANNSGFPFKDGMVIRCGNVKSTEGKFNNSEIGTVCSGATDSELQAVNCKNGNCDGIRDASFVKFNFVAESNKFSFNYLFASNEYGMYQCGFSDAFAFLLTDLSVAGSIPQNLAIIPGTTEPVSVANVRQQKFNSSCADKNPTLFGKYNASYSSGSAIGDPDKSAINMVGQTVPLKTEADVIPGHTYSFKLVIGDYRDTNMDSAVFIEAGSFNFGQSQLGLDDNKLLGLSYSPNPVQNLLYINSEEMIESVSVINMLGQELYRGNHNDKLIQTDMSALPAGTYFVRVQANNKSEIFKIVKE